MGSRRTASHAPGRGRTATASPARRRQVRRRASRCLLVPGVGSGGDRYWAASRRGTASRTPMCSSLRFSCPCRSTISSRWSWMQSAHGSRTTCRSRTRPSRGRPTEAHAQPRPRARGKGRRGLTELRRFRPGRSRPSGAVFAADEGVGAACRTAGSALRRRADPESVPTIVRCRDLPGPASVRLVVASPTGGASDRLVRIGGSDARASPT